MRVAVIGHVEWVELARVERVPGAGEIVEARTSWDGPAGGGAVAAVALAELAGGCELFTALGRDDLGERSVAALAEFGVTLHVAWRDEAPTRRGWVHVDDDGERTITVIGPKLRPGIEDPLPWELLRDVNGAFFVAGEPSALEAARGARVLTATSRERTTLARAGVQLDALIGSGQDPAERYERGGIEPEPPLVVRTAGPEGGAWESVDGRAGSWHAQPLPGPAGDAYGCGDAFAAAVTYALARGDAPADAVALGARCGARMLTRRGPYGGAGERL